MIIWLLSLASIVNSQQLYLQKFNISLDDPPETRWIPVLECKKEQILNTYQYIESLLSPIERKLLSSLLIASKVFPNEVIREMESAANYLNVDLSLVHFANFVNEMSSGCSSFLIQNSKNEIILGRNLDFFLGDFIRNQSVDLSFYRSGKLLYRSAAQAGYFGVSTGTKPGKFSITVNQRYLKDSSLIWNTLNLLSSSQISGFSIRWALENLESYNDAFNFFINVPFVVGEYICLAGLDQAAIITKNRRFAADIRQIDEENWFLVQTNSDHWLPQPKNDDRYNPAIKRIKGLGQRVMNEDFIFELMTIQPTYAPSTVLTVVSNPSTDYWFGVGWRK